MRAAAWLLLALLPAVPGGAAAQERILSYDSEVQILSDGSLEVTERIAVWAEGSQVRRGIYRDFPTRYRDRYGNRYVVDFEVLGLERNGAPEPWFTERMSNGIRVNTGNDDLLQVPARHEFTLRFRTSRQLGFFDAHDELYWNAIGAGWVFPIESSTVEVRLPVPVAVDSMSAEGYTGFQGDTGQDYTAELPSPGVARYRLTSPLQPRQAFTVVLTFPKGIIPEPGRAQRAGWVLRDNVPVLVTLLGVLALLFYCVREWRRVGRDPRPGVIIARYEPPAGHTPGSLRFLRRMGYDTRCFSGDVLSLAVGGHLRVRCDRKFLREQWRLERTDADATLAPQSPGSLDAAGGTPLAGRPGPQTRVRTLLPAEAALLHGLFAGNASTLELKSSNATAMQAARSVHQKSLDRQLHGTFFERNTRSVWIGIAILVATLLPAFFLSSAMDGAGLPFVFVGVGVGAVTLMVFGSLVRAPTKRGRALLDEVEGLRLYLSVAERDDIARLRGPEQPPLLDAERFEMLLPFAVALEVEDAWTKKFTAAVGAAAAAEAARSMTWYGGSRPIRDVGGFTRAVGSSLNSQISSASSPPGSSSGSGGGGSAGGGGGGGGGGGR